MISLSEPSPLIKLILCTKRNVQLKMCGVKEVTEVRKKIWVDKQ